MPGFLETLLFPLGSCSLGTKSTDSQQCRHPGSCSGISASAQRLMRLVKIKIKPECARCHLSPQSGPLGVWRVQGRY